MRRWRLLSIAVGLVIVMALVCTNLGLVASARPDARQRLYNTSIFRTPAPQKPRPIAFVGDSLTVGYFASDEAHDYAFLLASTLQAAPDVQAAFGQTAVASARVIQNSNPKVPFVPPQSLAVVVELGTNDVVEPNETLAQFSDSYQQILTRLKHDAPQALFLCLGTWRDPSVATKWNNIIQSLCGRIGGIYVDLGALYLTNAYHGPVGSETWLGYRDSLHPNDAGHAAIAQAVEAAAPGLLHGCPSPYPPAQHIVPRCFQAY